MKLLIIFPILIALVLAQKPKCKETDDLRKLWPFPGDSSQYYQCIDIGEPMLLKCLYGTSFDPLKEKCVRENVKPPTKPTGSPTKPTEGPPTPSTKDPTGGPPTPPPTPSTKDPTGGPPTPPPTHPTKDPTGGPPLPPTRTPKPTSGSGPPTAAPLPPTVF